MPLFNLVLNLSKSGSAGSPISVHSTSAHETQPHFLAMQVSNEPWPYPKLPSLVRGWLQH